MDFVHKFYKNAFTDFEILQKKSGIFLSVWEYISRARFLSILSS